MVDSIINYLLSSLLLTVIINYYSLWVWNINTLLSALYLWRASDFCARQEDEKSLSFIILIILKKYIRKFVLILLYYLLHKVHNVFYDNDVHTYLRKQYIITCVCLFVVVLEKHKQNARKQIETMLLILSKCGVGGEAYHNNYIFVCFSILLTKTSFQIIHNNVASLSMNF